MFKKNTADKSRLENIPGVGKSIAADLRELGIQKTTDLVGKKPQQLYDNLCSLRKMHMDPCMLYVFRCAVYFAENQVYETELLKWWNWKNRIY